MLVELGFEVRYALLEVGVGLEELSKLGLLELEHQETAADKGTHGRRRGRPVVGGNTSRWRRIVHAASMREVGAAVKRGRSDGCAEAP